MFFGATSFSSTPFAGVGITNVVVNATGNRINIAIGNTNVNLVTTVPVTGTVVTKLTVVLPIVIFN